MLIGYARISRMTRTQQLRSPRQKQQHVSKSFVKELREVARVTYENYELGAEARLNSAGESACPTR